MFPLKLLTCNSILTLETPMGQVPVLEIDGIQINQSISMARYVSKLVGLAGNNDWENLLIDIAVDNVVELRLSKTCCIQYTYATD